MMLIERAVAPLDALRTRAYRLAGPWASPWLASRERRVAILGALTVATALAATLGLPLTLLVWAPLVLGVPHLLSDLRYLVVRPGLHRRGPVLAAVGVPLAMAGAVGDIRLGLLAPLGAVAVGAGSWQGKRWALGVGAVLLGAATAFPAAADLVFLHVHNLVAGVAWWLWRGGRTRAQAAVAGAALLAWVALASGLLDPFVSNGGPFVAGINVSGMARDIAPGRTPLAYHLLLAWIFAQSIHYGLWLRLIPEDDRPRYTPRPFAASARALVGDLGWPMLALAVVAWAVVLAWGLADPVAARIGYLRGALFHGHLELAALALAFVERRRLGEALT